MRTAVILLMLGPGLAAAADGCGAALGAGAARAESEHYAIVYRTVPDPVAVGRPFALDAVVCPKSGSVPLTGLRVDAQMPAHRHGMNYRPTVTAEGAGRYRAEGLLFHMPGQWQFVFDFDAPGVHERATRDFAVE